jgi:hypothetical protein
MRFRAVDLHSHGWQPPQTLQIPDWWGCSTEHLPVAAEFRLVAARADLGARPGSDPAAALGAPRPVLGDGPMILRLTPKTAGRAGTSGRGTLAGARSGTGSAVAGSC